MKKVSDISTNDIEEFKAREKNLGLANKTINNHLVDGAEGVWKDAILTFLKTGMRLGELIALQWPDVNLDNGTIAIRYSWSNAKKGLETPKSNKVRHIPLTRELIEMLSRKRQKQSFVFAIDGGRIGTRRMDKHLKLV